MLTKTGIHIEHDKKSGRDVTYKAGDTLESETNLVERFPNKFVRLDVELVPGGNVPQPTVPVPHRYIKEPVPPSTTDEKESDVAETPTEPEIAETPTEPETVESETVESETTEPEKTEE